MYTNRNLSDCTQNEIAAAIQIWNRAAISLVDIRHSLISPKEALHGYRLPAGAFLYTCGGKAEITLNDIAFTVDRFGLFHGSKGTQVRIQPQCEWLEYYMVLYKAGNPPFQRREYSRLIENNDPFRLLYGFPPDNPIFIAELLRKMYEKWKGPTPLNLFYGKAAFYQLVYAVYEGLEKGLVYVFQPDSIAMANRYLDEHYSSEISMQALCEMLGISYSHFYKSFKERNGVSPQEYLIQVRLSAAKHWLGDSDMPMRAIADITGFANERNFYRMFAKHYGISPNTFRTNASLSRKDYAIGNIRSFPYNEKSQVSLDELKGKGAPYMFKQMKNKAVIAAALSLMLLLSACGIVPADANHGDLAPTTAVTTQVAGIKDPAEAGEGTRTISTVMGDVEVPANPQRIVVDYLIGDVVSLGVVPVGVSKADYTGSVTAFAEQITESVSVGEWDLEPEAVMALEPDLIFLAFSEKPYEDLSKIAPTIYVPYGSMTTEERIEFMGNVLNRQEEAAQAIAAYQEKIRQGKQRLQDAGLSSATVTIGQFNDNGNYIAGARHAVGVVVYNELGLSAPEKVQSEIIDADEYWGNISMEVLEPYCGDFLISLDNLTSSVGENAVWKLIPAVQNNRIISIDTAISWYTDIMSSSALVDIIVDELIKLK